MFNFKYQYRFCLLVFFCCVGNYSSAQKLSLDSCYAKAILNYPLINQYALIEKTKAYSIENLNSGFLPIFNIGGQLTYQSEVTKLPISIPGRAIPELKKDQYKVYGEILQPITDLIAVKYQKDVVVNNTDLEKKKVEVDLFKLKERINQTRWVKLNYLNFDIVNWSFKDKFIYISNQS